MALCDDVIESPPDVACEEANTALVTAFHIVPVNKPIVLPTPTPAGETLPSRLARELARRWNPTNVTDPIEILKVRRGVWPLPTPNFKTDPNNGGQYLSKEDTPLRIEGTDYRDNQEVYEYWKKVVEASRQVGVYVEIGKYLYFGSQVGDTLYPIVGSFNASFGVIDDANVSHRKPWSFNWFGSPLPARILLPV